MHTNIKTFEDACKSENISTELPNVSVIPELEQEAVINFYKALIICKALNNTVEKDWRPNWNNYSEQKYYPWFDLENYDKTVSGSGFSFDGCAYVDSGTFVGSRLCFINSELATYAGKQFTDVYKAFFTFPVN